MIRRACILTTILTSLWLLSLAAPAAAHPGHLADVAGHSHWIALGGVALAAAIAAALARARSRRRKDGASADPTHPADPAKDAASKDAAASEGEPA